MTRAVKDPNGQKGGKGDTAGFGKNGHLSHDTVRLSAVHES
jgi:hypothetical protein